MGGSKNNAHRYRQAYSPPPIIQQRRSDWDISVISRTTSVTVFQNGSASALTVASCPKLGIRGGTHRIHRKENCAGRRHNTTASLYKYKVLLMEFNRT